MLGARIGQFELALEDIEVTQTLQVEDDAIRVSLGDGGLGLQLAMRSALRAARSARIIACAAAKAVGRTSFGSDSVGLLTCRENYGCSSPGRHGGCCAVLPEIGIARRVSNTRPRIIQDPQGGLHRTLSMRWSLDLVYTNLRLKLAVCGPAALGTQM